MCSISELEAGFKAVKRNGGAPGVDGVTIEEFEKNLKENLRQLQADVESWRYEPKPVRRVEIAKPQGGVRLLGIPTVRDRTLQASMKAVLEPKLEPLFSESSFGFRPKRNQKQAVEQAQRIVKSGKEYVVDIDLSKFFDRIHHDRLIHRLGGIIEDRRVLRLIGIILRSGIMQDGLVKESREGSVQGSPLSPLLSNVVLDELDKELENRGLEFCRFADDCKIFVRTLRAAERVMETITRFIEKKLKLVVNREKSQVAPSKFVKFLGMTIVAGTIAISMMSMKRAMGKVRELTPRGTSMTIEQSAEKINKWYIGWSGYYQMTQYPYQLQMLEAHLRRRLRSRIVDQQKSRRNLAAKIYEKTRSKRLSGSIYGYRNRGRWALSHSPAMERAFPNAWFTQIGLKTISEEQRPHWFKLRKKPYLT
jgi:group II intron reverse transcriptase/maturase